MEDKNYVLGYLDTLFQQAVVKGAVYINDNKCEDIERYIPECKVYDDLYIYKGDVFQVLSINGESRLAYQYRIKYMRNFNTDFILDALITKQKDIYDQIYNLRTIINKVNRDAYESCKNVSKSR